MRIAVYGAGGVGGYFGGRLAQVGEEVTFIARGEHLQAIQARGLKVESPKGDFTIYPARAVADPADVGHVEVVLVAVKAWQVPEIAPAIRPLLGPETIVVPLGNGVEAPGQLVAALDTPQGRHVLGGLCRISSFIAAPGLVRHVGVEPYIAFGELDGTPNPVAVRLEEAFTRAGVSAEIPADILAAMWAKFIFIAAISGVGAVTRSPAGVFRSLPETRPMLEAAVSEAAEVSRAYGVNLPEDIVARTLATIDGLPEGTVASLSRDLLDGRPSELEAQNGAVVRLGQALGIPTPTHAFIYASLLPQERRARKLTD